MVGGPLTVTVNSIQCRIEASSIYCKYRKYRSIVDTWLGIGIDAAQVPRYLQSIEYRPGTSINTKKAHDSLTYTAYNGIMAQDYEAKLNKQFTGAPL